MDNPVISNIRAIIEDGIPNGERVGDERLPFFEFGRFMEIFDPLMQIYNTITPEEWAKFDTYNNMALPPVQKVIGWYLDVVSTNYFSDNNVNPEEVSKTFALAIILATMYGFPEYPAEQDATASRARDFLTIANANINKLIEDGVLPDLYRGLNLRTNADKRSTFGRNLKALAEASPDTLNEVGFDSERIAELLADPTCARASDYIRLAEVLSTSAFAFVNRGSIEESAVIRQATRAFLQSKGAVMNTNV